MAIIHIHGSLSHYTDNQTSVDLPIVSAGDIIPALCQAFPRLKKNLVNIAGELNPYVHCYVNDKSLMTYAPEKEIQQTDRIDFITALVGG